MQLSVRATTCFVVASLCVTYTYFTNEGVRCGKGAESNWMVMTTVPVRREIHSSQAFVFVLTNSTSNTEKVTLPVRAYPRTWRNGASR